MTAVLKICHFDLGNIWLFLCAINLEFSSGTQWNSQKCLITEFWFLGIDALKDAQLERFYRMLFQYILNFYKALCQNVYGGKMQQEIRQA